MNDKQITLTVFSRRLRQLREERDLTTLQLMKNTGISDATISRYETGKRDPNLKLVIRLADYFNVSLEWLCGLEFTNDEFTTLYNELTDEQKQDAYRYMLFLKAGN